MTQAVATFDVVPSLRDDHLERPLGRRLPASHAHYDEILARHRAAVERGLPAYRDPVSGLSVFTAAFLAERGWCCASGCRHCPWEPGSTPAG
jgi:hypothetical protein